MNFNSRTVNKNEIIFMTTYQNSFSTIFYIFNYKKLKKSPVAAATGCTGKKWTRHKGRDTFILFVCNLKHFSFQPCPGPPMDSRAEQCAAYDRRPFRGRFYTWVPYVDGR